jgi:large subunit ribosomal protein L15
MPLQRRIPKFGFTSPFRTEYAPLNVDDVEAWISDGELAAKITPDDLRDKGILAKTDLVKLLGRGEIEQTIDIKVHACSESAQKKVEEAGGSITIIKD